MPGSRRRRPAQRQSRSLLLWQVQRRLVAETRGRGAPSPAGGVDRREERLRRGAMYLRSVRDGDHGWRKLPFWYTVLALSEMDCAEATRELKHAAPALDRVAQRPIPSAVFASRRHALAVRALN